MKQLIVLSLLLFFPCLLYGQDTLRPFSFKGFAIKAQIAGYHSFVKSNELPIGRQFVYAYGGSIGYYSAKMTYAVFFNCHKSFYSIANGLLMYREYQGYECGIGIRRTLSDFKIIPHTAWGVGLILAGNYDRYTLFKQYMVYPTIGGEVFLLHNLFGKNIFPVEVCIPIAYSFRQAGHYVNMGISLQIGLCTP